MALIACGVLALVIAIWQYRWMASYLRSGAFAQIAGVPERKMQSPIVAVALLLIFVGLFAFFAVLLRLP
jgi:putative membrane protein